MEKRKPKAFKVPYAKAVRQMKENNRPILLQKAHELVESMGNLSLAMFIVDRMTTTEIINLALGKAIKEA